MREGINSVKLNPKKWVSVDSLLSEINDMIDSVELAGYENPIDEAYHNALLNVKEAIASNSSSDKSESFNKD